MIADNSNLNKYVLINTSLRSYALIEKTELTEHEASNKNMALGLNGVKKKYVLEENWKEPSEEEKSINQMKRSRYEDIRNSMG